MEYQQLLTQWQFDGLEEYPRPQLQRDSFICLNGKWSYGINKSKTQADYDGDIIVPFSPESVLSGVNKTIDIDEYLHYKRMFVIPQGFNKGKVLLNFGAVDMFCQVSVNGKTVGEHDNGYLPFSFDITKYLIEGQNQLEVTVWDYSDSSYFTHSKQQKQRGGIWYTPTCGIWQTVWLESVAEDYVTSLRITPDYDNSQVEIELKRSSDEEGFVGQIYFEDNAIASFEAKSNKTVVKMDGFLPWTPETPNLYSLKLTAGKDEIASYFGMRKYSIETIDGKKRICLNNKPYFMTGLLDQGYWSDGIYTAPSDKALAYDVEEMKRLGFNTLRKHIKVEPLRWYYHCDKIGMIVWQDMMSGGRKPSRLIREILPFVGINLNDANYKLFGRNDKEGREAYYKEYNAMLDLLYNCVSLAVWTPFNEGWGQFDAKKFYRLTKEKDPTRLVDHASGWHDQKCGDFKSLHIYYKAVPNVKDQRAVVLSEFGGYSHKVEGHSFNLGKTFGYKIFDSKEQLTQAYSKLYEKEILPRIKSGLCACIYTQLSDVEDEVNGILTYDRKVVKIDEETVKSINAELTKNND